MIAELPPEIQILINNDPAQATALWAWVSTLHYAQVVEQAGADHWLVRIKQRFDFTRLEQACASYRLYAGQQGVEATYPLGQLCCGVVLKALQQWSYAQVASEVPASSLLRWFVGAGLKEPIFSATTLWRFEHWLKRHQPRLFFTELLQQIDADFPAARTAVQSGDTFALLARPAEQTRTALLRQASGKVLHYLAMVTAPGYAQVMGQMAGEALLAQADEPREMWLDKPARDALEERTALAAMRLRDCVQQVQRGLPPTRALGLLALQRWVGILDKVLGDEFTFDRAENGDWVKATLRTKHIKGSYVIGSTVDPDATFRQHGDKSQLGYNINVAATPQFIREINAVSGATPDGNGVATLVANQRQHLGVVPPKLLYDRAAGSPKIFHDVAQASDGQTQLVARLIDHSKNSQRYGPLDFTLHEDGSLTCPNGQTSTTSYRSQSADGWNYRFAAAQCQDCPLWQPCRGDAVARAAPLADTAAASAPTPATPKTSARKTPKPTAYRQVFISHYRERQRHAILYTQTDAFRLDMRQRCQIERVIAGLVRYHGARHATGYGLVNADYQVRMAALAFNLKSWLTLTIAKEKPVKRSKPTPDST